MEILHKSKILLKMCQFIRLLIICTNFLVYSSVNATSADSIKEKNMVRDIKNSVFQAINSTTKIISRESTIEKQLDEHEVFFDEASPHYPKRGPLIRYSLSHNREVKIDFFKDNNSSEWNSAYISLGSKSAGLKDGGCYNLEFVKRAKLSYVGVYEKEGVYPSDDGEKMTYKFHVVRYRYKDNVIVDFKAMGEKPNGEIYPLVFNYIHVYVGS